MENKGRKFWQERNWQKARLLGFNIQEKYLTPNEIIIYKKLATELNILKDNWDRESQTLTNNKLPKYRCWCGKKTHVKRESTEHEDVLLCKQHYIEEQNGKDTN